MTERICSIPGCEKPKEARGWCKAHYARWRRYGDPLHKPIPKQRRRYKPAEERFFANFKEDAQGCWIWLRPLNTAGYGRFGANKKVYLAHRWAYEHFRGPIPAGLELDHLCRVPSCVNPTHLEAVTHQENLHRGIRFIPKTHCKWGHEFSPENTFLRNGKRVCRACMREHNRRYRERQKLVMRGREE